MTIVSVAAIVFLTVTHRKLSVKAADLPSEQLIFEDLADLTPEESWLDWQTLRQLPPRRLSPYGRAETNWQFYRNVAAGLALTGVAVAGLASIVRRGATVYSPRFRHVAVRKRLPTLWQTDWISPPDRLRAIVCQ